jgi:hypothetical protein
VWRAGSPAVLAFFDNECVFLIFSKVLVSTGKTRFPFDDSLIVFVGICLSSIFIIMKTKIRTDIEDLHVDPKDTKSKKTDKGRTI